jgi:hypothetical protein
MCFVIKPKSIAVTPIVPWYVYIKDIPIIMRIYKRSLTHYIYSMYNKNKGWIVEFTVEKDEEDDNGKPKATRVTAVGGGPCTGPAGNKSTRRKQHVKRQQQQRTNRDGDDAADASSSSSPWHDMLDDHVKSVLHNAKRISTETGTLDVSVDKTVKVKLGTAGYASMAHADGIVAEGTFACTPEGTVSLHWARAISFQNGEWQTTSSVSGLLSTFSLVDGECHVHMYACMYLHICSTDL